MSFSELLKQCRKKQGVSQAELAAKLGVTQQAVGKWESGKSSPDPATVARIAEILSTTADFLLGLYRPVSNVTTPEERFFGNYAESLIPVIGTVKAGYGALAFEEDYGQEYARVKDPSNYFYLVVRGDSMEPRMAGYYTALGKAAGAVIKRVPAGKLQKLCGTQDHQGVAAWAARIQYVGVEELLQIAKDRGEPPFLVLCDGIEDPHNLGAILRSALLCGAHGVIIPRRGGVGVTGTVMKASAGAAARLPIARVSNLAQAIRTIKEHNIFVYCADLGGAPLAKTDLSGPVALVLGSEGGGPGALTRKLCDAAVTLEMAPGQATGVDSYNVSVAAGILCYDVMRRRLAKK